MSTIKYNYSNTDKSNDNNTYSIKRKDGSTTIMEEPEFVRWMCLIEGMIHINNMSDDLQLTSEVDEALHMKPIALQAYIDERYNSMLHDVQVEKKLGNL